MYVWVCVCVRMYACVTRWRKGRELGKCAKWCNTCDVSVREFAIDSYTKFKKNASKRKKMREIFANVKIFSYLCALFKRVGE